MPRVTPRIIGIVGHKRSGKDTICALIRYGREATTRRLAFADALKAEISNLLGVTIDKIDGDKARFRGILQWWGTEWRRGQSEDYWIDRLDGRFNDLPHTVEMVVVTDVRFANEADWVRRRGGKILRVIRPTDQADPHASEQLDAIAVDFVINNDGTLEQLGQKVASWLAINFPDHANG